MNKYLHHFLALVVVAIWGVTFISTKVLILAGLHPDQIFALRFTMAYLGIWVLSLFSADSRKLFCASLRDEMIMLFLGITGGSFYFLTENTALAYTQACNVAFIVCSAPLITMLMTLFCKRFFKGSLMDGLQDIKPGWTLLLGTVLALAGMSMVVFSGMVLKLSPKGDLLALCAAMCWGAYSIFMAQMTQRYGSVFATRKVFFYGLLTIIPFMLKDGLPDMGLLVQPQVMWNLIFLGVVASLICFVVWNRVMAVLGNVTSTNYVYLNPIFTLISSMIFLGERMTLMSAAGSALILLGVIVSGIKNNQ